MKNLVIIASMMFIWACSPSNKENHEHEADAKHEHAEPEKTAEAKKPLSPHTATMANIGNNHVHVDYSSPGKRDRTIFGGLVGYGSVWSTGAHTATHINFSKDVTIGGVSIPAGKYGFFTIPGETEWTIIINKDWDMHLADDYNEANDIVRVKAIPEKLNEIEESLVFEVNEIDEQKGTVSFRWDNVAVSFEVVNQ
jgi:hypothetical protein